VLHRSTQKEVIYMATRKEIKAIMKQAAKYKDEGLSRKEALKKHGKDIKE